jgi:hypothetical protein
LISEGKDTAAARVAAQAAAAGEEAGSAAAKAAASASECRRLRRLTWGAAAAAVATRVPFAAQRLWDHDSVQFALGVERYDLAAHHPHPPGYPLYIAVLKLLAALGVSSEGGMVALAIAGAALGAWLIVPLTARLAALAVAGVPMAGPSAPGPPGPGPGPAPGGPMPVAAGALAAVLYVFNPLLWFYGELPLIYAVEGGMAVGLAYAAMRMADGPVPFVTACAAFALAGGVRPSTLVLLLPLWALGVGHACGAWGVFRGLRRDAAAEGGANGRGRRRAMVTLGAGLVAGGAVGLAWLVPLLAAAGGLASYRRIGSEHFSALLPYTSILYGAGWPALAHNLTIMSKWALQGLVPAAVALAALWLPAGARREARTRVAGGLRLLAASWPWLVAWALPPVLFLALFHVTKAGYTLIYLPALLVAAGLLGAPAMVAPSPTGRAEKAGRAGAASRAGDPGQAREPGQAGEPGRGGEDGRAGATGRVGWNQPRAAAALLLAAGSGAALFLCGADRRPDQPRALAVVRNEFNRHAIAAFERDLDRLVAELRELPAAETVLATVELSGTGPAGAEGFLYPWQRHLQWYLPDYEVLHLVPEERLAFVTRGHRPFQRAGPWLTLPPGTRRLAIVLSGPTGKRFPLDAWPRRRIGETFWLVVVPLPAAGRLDLGPFTFAVAAAARAA